MSASAIRNLWSEDIRVDILTPIAILQSQKEHLYLITKGILQADIQANERKDGKISLQFDVVAPALGYSYKLLSVTYDRTLVYPVRVNSSFIEMVWGESGEEYPEANTEQEFMDLVRKIFQSAGVRSIIQSLIARSNELSAQSTHSAQEEVADENPKDQR